MSEEQELHLSGLQNAIRALVDSKYRHGAEEHDGDLKDLSAKALVVEALMEQIDGVVYLLTALEKME